MPIVDTTRPWVPPKRIAPSRIVSRTFSIWWQSLSQLLAIAAFVHVPLLALKWWLHEGGEESWRATFLGVLPVLNLTVLPNLIEGLAVLLVFQRLRGEPVDVARSIRQGTRRLGTILAIAAIIFAVMLVIPTIVVVVTALSSSKSRGLESSGVAEALMLAIAIPMLIVVLLYSLVFIVSIPAAIVEGHRPFQAFNRSRILTSGARGRIILTWLLFGLVTLIPTAILQAFLKSIKNPTSALLAEAVVSWFVASLGCVLPIVLYHDLRETKEGIGIDELLKVFE